MTKETLINTVQAQVKAYEMEYHRVPTVQELVAARYIKSDRCPNGHAVQISADGAVSESGS
ncbi:hypothetical protein [Geobacillus sp. B4113_201601]|uniref:hypothetical protein n=1 Tax=Geobacillus sp. B4113_201601 TaxID=1586290 RepID=UPI000A68F2E6|nr:hypothetical protein [Geobacillus sp. B4113_201601]